MGLPVYLVRCRAKWQKGRHHPPEIETGSGLADHGAQQGIRQERPGFVEDRRDGFLAEGTRPTRERVCKEIEDGGVLDVPQKIGPISVIREKLRKREEGCGRGLLNECPERIAEYVFEPWSPRSRPQLVEDAHDVRDNQAPLFRARAVEHV
jgi:hypothetical protein